MELAASAGATTTAIAAWLGVEIPTVSAWCRSASRQRLDRTQPLLPRKPEQVGRRTHDDARDGTVSLFAALDAKTGEVIGRCDVWPGSHEFRKILDQIERPSPPRSMCI